MIATVAMMPRTMGPMERFMGVSYPDVPDDCVPTTSGVRRSKVLRESPAERPSASLLLPMMKEC